MALGWMYSPSQIGRYLLTRIPSLKPPRTEKMQNPISVIRQLDRHQWLMFWAGFIGWTCEYTLARGSLFRMGILSPPPSSLTVEDVILRTRRGQL